VGGGPAGLYFALLMKLREPRHEITVFERNAAGLTYGWGVVFGSDLLAQLYRNDPGSAQQIDDTSFRWVNEVADVEGERVYAECGGYSINRQRLLDILADRARGLGVQVEFGHDVTALAQLPPADLVVACDGVSSRVRLAAGAFQTDVRTGSNKYIWLGTDRVFRSFTFPFVRTDYGWVWAHAYGYDAESSTFIVECAAETWAGLGFDTMSPRDGLALLEKLFERHLDGRQLIGHARDDANIHWLNFRAITNQRWYDGRTVLMGDAAHTTHFTIGSGTKLAIEDAIALAGNLSPGKPLELGLQSYERQRQTELLQLQSEARFSAQWFENIPRYIDLEPDQFFALLRERRSPLLPRVPPRLFYQLHRATEEVTVLRELRRRVGGKAVTAYGRRKAVRPEPGSAPR
jgi:2-polyprenyl-6-methoxyphenol hydroxylase-like FAD-dependent oxidoreductase